MIKRRFFLKYLLMLSAGVFLPFKWMESWLRTAEAAVLPKTKKVYLRPPGALPEEKFLVTCINCHRCGQACPNDCIKYINDPFNPVMHDTPHIVPREKACILCMKCTQACPSGALQPVADDEGETILKHVKIGTAVVDTNICNSYNGYACGVCVRACPFSGVALKAETWERPVVADDKCVGCGLCEQSCIHYPQAIRVVPIQRV